MRERCDYIEVWEWDDTSKRSVAIGNVENALRFPQAKAAGYVASYFDRKGSPYQSVSGSRLRMVDVYAGDACAWQPDRCTTSESR